MRILFVVPSLKSGGLERVASLLSSDWAGREGLVVNLITLDSKPAFYPLDERIKLLQAPKGIDEAGGWRKAVKLWFWLPKQAKRFDPDIILCFGEGYNAFVVANLGFLKKPIFLSNRTTPITSLSGKRGLINPIFYKNAHRVFVQTRKSVQILSPKYKGTHFEVIPNPIKEISNTLDYTKKTILNVGSIGGKKNQLGLIKIFAGLHKNYQDWHLVFAGDGPDRDHLELFVKENGLQNHVHFKGVIRDLDQVYSEASIFAFTSLLEGFPNALGEAMSAGIAVIAYDCLTGPADLITNGVNGFLIELNDELKFQKQLARLMSDRELRANLGEEARKSIQAYSVEHIANQHLEYFKKSLMHD